MAVNEKKAGILGIEGGGTKTTWALLTRDGKILAQGSAGPGNTLLLSDAALEKLFRDIRREAGTEVEAIGGAFAGCQLAAEKTRVEKILRRVWLKAGVVRVMEDTRSVLAAAFGDGPGIVVIAGTGSNVAGQKTASDPIEKAGGWGHLFSDEGSAYDITHRGLQSAFVTYDVERKVSPLAREFLMATNQNSMEELVAFLLKDTSKTAFARWAQCVFAAHQKGDKDASRVLEWSAKMLSGSIAVVARRFKFTSLKIALTGGLLENQPAYLKIFQRILKKEYPGCESFLLKVPGVFGAARLAGLEKLPDTEKPAQKSKAIAEPSRLAAFAAASTEQRNPRSRGLDKRSIPQLVALFIKEERYVEKALVAQRKQISQAATLVAKKLSGGGRLFYVGAGTSGRLGVVDASEMPPTFNAPPEQVQAIIAGGAAAVFRSQEGAEDARDTGVAELKLRGLTKKDVVCGIAASGQTPFVLGALDFARNLGAGTIFAHLQSEALDPREGRRRDRLAHGTRNRDRLDPDESRDGNQACAQYAQHHRNGETRSRAR